MYVYADEMQDSIHRIGVWVAYLLRVEESRLSISSISFYIVVKVSMRRQCKNIPPQYTTFSSGGADIGSSATSVAFSMTICAKVAGTA